MFYGVSDTKPLLPKGTDSQAYGGTEHVSSFENDFCHFLANNFYKADDDIDALYERLSERELKYCSKEKDLNVLREKLSALVIRMPLGLRSSSAKQDKLNKVAQSLLDIITILRDKLSPTVGESKASTGTKVGSSSSDADVPAGSSEGEVKSEGAPSVVESYSSDADVPAGSSVGEPKSESEAVSSVSPDDTQFTVVQCLLHADALRNKLGFRLRVCVDEIGKWRSLDCELRSKEYRRRLVQDMWEIENYLKDHKGKGLEDDAQRKHVFDLSKKLTKVDKHLLDCDEFLTEAQNYHPDEVAIYQRKKEQLNKLRGDLRELHYQEEAFIKFSAAEKASTAAAVCCTVPLCAASSALVCMAGAFALSTGIGGECNGAGAGCKLMCCFACSGDGLRPDDSSSTCCGSGKPYRNACGVLGSLCSSPSEEKKTAAQTEATGSVKPLTMD